MQREESTINDKNKQNTLIFFPQHCVVFKQGKREKHFYFFTFYFCFRF